jgi:hypothetical protein
MAGRLGDQLARGADVVSTARTFMGADGHRRYFLALQNNAEMRDQGMVLAYATLSFDAGHLRVEQEAGITDPTTTGGRNLPGGLRLSAPVSVSMPPGMHQVFGDIHPNWLWQSVNAGADFSWSGQAMSQMYRQATGESVNGVIAIDVPGLAALLSAVGPVRADGVQEQISADNLARIVLHDFYQSVPRGAQSVRHQQLSDVAAAIIARMVDGQHDLLTLGRQLNAAAAGGHLRLWSADAPEEATFQRTGLAGDPAAQLPDRTFHLAVENRNATKMDYYVQVKVRQDVHLTKLGMAVVRTSVTVEDQAPLDGKPSYMLGPDGFAATRPGEYWAWVLLWAPRASIQPGTVEQAGLRLDQQILERIEAGQQRLATFETVIPNAVRNRRLDLRYVPQPRLTPVQLEVALDAPDWHIEGQRDWAGELNHTFTLSWHVNR